VEDSQLSENLTGYLHQHHLPYVDAVVFTGADGNPVSISLSGEVRTEKGKDDAETKSEDFLGTEHLHVRNRVEINPALATASAGSMDSGGSTGQGSAVSAADSCADLCHKDQGYCSSHCANQSVGSAGGLSSLGDLIGLGAQKSDCDLNCNQTLDHCLAGCSQNGGQAAGGPGGPTSP
jgi:hypothetical protein